MFSIFLYFFSTFIITIWNTLYFLIYCHSLTLQNKLHEDKNFIWIFLLYSQHLAVGVEKILNKVLLKSAILISDLK